MCNDADKCSLFHQVNSAKQLNSEWRHLRTEQKRPYHALWSWQSGAIVARALHAYVHILHAL